MPKALFKSDDELFEAIQRCRTSGMTDKDWRAANGISHTPGNPEAYITLTLSTLSKRKADKHWIISIVYQPVLQTIEESYIVRCEELIFLSLQGMNVIEFHSDHST